jgi:multidrug resistance efflux pump
VWSYIANLDEEELLEVRAGAHVKLSVDMHPTCPVTVSVFEPAEAPGG